MSKQMSLEEFQEAVGWGLWNDSLKQIYSKHRKMVADDILELADKSKGTSEVLVWHSAKILNGFGKQAYQSIVEVVNELVENDKNSASLLLFDSEKILERIAAVSSKYIPIVFGALKSGAKTNGKTVYNLAEGCYRVLENITQIDSKYVRVVFNAVSKIIENEGMAAYHFAKRSADVLKDVIKVDRRYIPVVFEAAGKLGRKQGDVVLDWFGISKVWGNAWTSEYEPSISNLLEKIGKGKNIDADYLLIESIENQKDAQIVGPLIDMEKYGDLYKEKVQRFY